MSKFLNLALEDEDIPNSDDSSINDKPNELEKAENMVNNEDSTDPVEIVKIANYKEELAALKEKAVDTSTNNDNEAGDDSSEQSETDTVTTEVEQDESEASGEAGVNDETSGSEEGEDTGATSNEGENAELDDSDEKQLTEAVESYITLNKLNKVVEKAQSRNSMSNVGLEMLQISLNGIKDRLGVLNSDRYQLPAMESDAGYTGRQKYLTAISVSLESFINDLWSSIVKMFKEIYKWITDFFFNKKATVAAARNDLKAIEKNNSALTKGLQKRAELVSKSSAENGTTDVPLFKNKKAYMLLTPGLDSSNPDSLNASMNDFSKVIAEQMTKMHAFIKAVIPLAGQVLNVQPGDIFETILNDLSLEKHFNVSGMNSVKEIPGEKGNGYKFFTTPAIPCNTAFYIKEIDGVIDEDKIDWITGQRYGAYDVVENPVNIDFQLILTEAAATSIVSYLKDLQHNREEILKMSEALSGILNRLNKDLTALKLEDDVNSKNKVIGLRIISALFSNVVLKGLIKLDTTITTYADLLKDYHSQSTKEYGSA